MVIVREEGDGVMGWDGAGRGGAGKADAGRGNRNRNRKVVEGGKGVIEDEERFWPKEDG